MEFGIKINDEKDLIRIPHLTKYKYIYFGSEFCEKKIPLVLTAVKIFDFCEKNEKIPVLLTPPLTEVGLTILKKLINELKKFYIEFEITINDFGLIEVLKQESQIKMNCGRLLIKMKKGPEITSGALKEVPENFKDNSLSNPFFIEFIKQFNINRFEVDLPFQGINLPSENLTNGNMSLYLGNSVLSVTRRCIYAKSDTKDYDYKINGCKKECLNCIIVKSNKHYDEPVYVAGNAEFLVGEMQINESLRGKFNRIVMFPGIKSNL
jgi:hypothetical protein